MSVPKLWKVVYDRSIPGIPARTRLITPDGHEVPGLMSMRQSDSGPYLLVEINLGSPIIVECVNADGTTNTREVLP